jgi:hypothetical protein
MNIIQKKYTAKKGSLKKYIITVLALIIILPLLYFWGTRFLIGQHQRQVITYLKQWENQFTSISSTKEAMDAIEMYEYARKYYVAGEGYCSSRRLSEELESQRTHTLEVIVQSLEKYTGMQYGHDYEKWKEWENIHTKESGESKDSHR